MMDHRLLNITLFREVESTNALALAALKEGAPEGTVFVADRQSAGRGRRQPGGERRPWFSPPGKNLYFSVVARPAVAVDQSAGLTLAVGVELADMLRRSTKLEIEVKWPNDLYVGERKLGGILTEGVTKARGLDGVAVGVGLNINAEVDEFPEELRQRATSLVDETGGVYDRLALAVEAPEVVLDACERYADEGLAAFSQRLKRWDWLRDRPVLVEGAEGRARGIGSRGGLKVEFDDGRIEEVISGEVTAPGTLPDRKAGR